MNKEKQCLSLITPRNPNLIRPGRSLEIGIPSPPVLSQVVVMCGPDGKIVPSLVLAVKQGDAEKNAASRGDTGCPGQDITGGRQPGPQYLHGSGNYRCRKWLVISRSFAGCVLFERLSKLEMAWKCISSSRGKNLT